MMVYYDSKCHGSLVLLSPGNVRDCKGLFPMKMVKMSDFQWRRKVNNAPIYAAWIRFFLVGPKILNNIY